MSINVTGQHMEVGESLRKYAIAESLKCINRHIHHAWKANVLFKKDGKAPEIVAEVIVYEAGHTYAVGQAENIEPYKAFDLALSKAVKQLKKAKDKNQHPREHE